jgi:hypothetical protein
LSGGLVFFYNTQFELPRRDAKIGRLRAADAARLRFLDRGILFMP